MTLTNRDIYILLPSPVQIYVLNTNYYCPCPSSCPCSWPCPHPDGLCVPTDRGMVRQRATSRSSVQLAFAFVVFRILSVTCSLTHALSQSLAHAQQFFSASTPGQILAPRVCTLVLFIFSVTAKPESSTQQHQTHHHNPELS